jgi:hypothetical protein
MVVDTDESMKNDDQLEDDENVGWSTVSTSSKKSSKNTTRKPATQPTSSTLTRNRTRSATAAATATATATATAFVRPLTTCTPTSTTIDRNRSTPLCEVLTTTMHDVECGLTELFISPAALPLGPEITKVHTLTTLAGPVESLAAIQHEQCSTAGDDLATGLTAADFCAASRGLLVADSLSTVPLLATR